jgi:hypothetical protein
LTSSASPDKSPCARGWVSPITSETSVPSTHR